MRLALSDSEELKESYTYFCLSIYLQTSEIKLSVCFRYILSQFQTSQDYISFIASIRCL